MKPFLIVTAMLAAAIAVPAAAQDSGGASNGPDLSNGINNTVTVGVVGVNLPDYEGSNDYRITPAPVGIGTVHGFAFSLQGNKATLDLIPNPKGPSWDIQAGPIGVVNLYRTSIKSIDDPRVKALGKVGTAIEVGGFVGIGKTGVITSPYDKISVSVSYRYDINGVHKSGILSPAFNYATPLSRKSLVGIAAQAEHVEQGYADTYFTVTPAGNLASGLPVYRARAGWKSYTLSALAAYSLTGDLLHGLKVVGAFQYKRLLNGFSYSPLVRVAGSPNQTYAALGLAYTF